jgi:hypothetical protein
MKLRSRPLQYEDWEREGDYLVSVKQAIFKPLNDGRCERLYIYTNPKRVGRILELLVQIEAILTELRSHIPDKPRWLFYRSGFFRVHPKIRGHEILFRLGEKRLKELNRLLSAYRWSPQIQILPWFLFQMRPRQTKKTTLSQRREYRIVETLLRDAERGNLYRYKTCPECKKWFYTLTDHQRFCGDSCRKRYASHSGEYKLKRREYMKTYRRKQKSLDRSALVSARRG